MAGAQACGSGFWPGAMPSPHRSGPNAPFSPGLPRIHRLPAPGFLLARCRRPRAALPGPQPRSQPGPEQSEPRIDLERGESHSVQACRGMSWGVLRDPGSPHTRLKTPTPSTVR